MFFICCIGTGSVIVERLIKVSAPSLASSNISEAGDNTIAPCNCDVCSNHYMRVMCIIWVLGPGSVCKKLQLHWSHRTPPSSMAVLHINVSETEENFCLQWVVSWPVSCDLSSQKAPLRNICSIFFIEVCKCRLFHSTDSVTEFPNASFCCLVICTVFLCRLKCVN